MQFVELLNFAGVKGSKNQTGGNSALTVNTSICRCTGEK